MTTTIDAAKLLNVSPATIYNWLKLGILNRDSTGKIAAESLTHIYQRGDKLKTRANKSLKNQASGINPAIFLDQVSQLDPKFFGDAYQTYLSDSYRNKEGIYYTPSYVVDDMFNATQLDTTTATFCDPCCGSGNFIIKALELGFLPQNIYGFDVDPVAVAITKQRVFEITGYESTTIVQADFLQAVMHKTHKLVDCIYTNPPWGKKIEKSKKIEWGSRLGLRNSLDTAALFLFACIASLKSNGELGFLLPESFFNIATFQEARQHVLQHHITHFINYNKPFKGLLTKAHAIKLVKKCGVASQAVMCSDYASTYRSVRLQSSFACMPQSIFNFLCDEQASTVINQLLKRPHITLKNKATWALGIVTGNNAACISDYKKDNYIPVFKGSDIISSTEIKHPSQFIHADMHAYQQVAPLKYYEAEKKLLYKFISSKLCFFYDTQQRYPLNSMNVLIPHDDFPMSQKILAAVLSSDFMNWVFSNLFSTYKILRSNLEFLPIYPEALSQSKSFNECDYINYLGLEKRNGTYSVKK